MKNTNTLIVTILILLIGFGIYSLSKKDVVPVQTENTPINNSNVNPTTNTSEDNKPVIDTSVKVNLSSTTKEFTVIGKNFSFTPNTLTVKKGDTVKITFQNSNGNHDFRIDEFKVKTSIIASGAEETVTFVADKTGSFEYYCSVGQHRAMGMKGILTVQ